MLSVPLAAQRVIPLYPGTAPGSQPAAQDERAYYSPAWGTQIVANVTRPTLTVYQPAPGKATGTSVVICPGGGFVALSINSEGVDVAKWLAARGVTAFVLKYRLAHTGDDAVAEFSNAMKTPGAFQALTGAVIPLAIADGQNAVTWVRAHADEFGIAPNRVGMMGFSAGGTIVAALAYHYTPDSRPAFVAPVYAYTGALPASPVPADAPPMFVTAATDDDLGLAPQSVALYSAWLAAKHPAELHMYAHGGHGFGMRTKHIATDTWIERFAAWLDEQGLLTPLRAPTVQYRSPAGIAYRSQRDTGAVARAEHALALDPKNVDKIIAL
ncbi:MAG: alpha/beta hydrolase, partial [Gemmatimonadetes bacterium]|nr:alpha/beta hydrolase [Gemmatimonadota bacterium]